MSTLTIWRKKTRKVLELNSSLFGEFYRYIINIIYYSEFSFFIFVCKSFNSTVVYKITILVF